MDTLSGRVELHHTHDGVLLDEADAKLMSEELAGCFESTTGERAEYHAVVQFAGIPGEQTWVQAIECYTFEDGSRLHTRVGLEQDGDLDMPYQAKVSILGGSGRFHGVSGEGKLEGTSDGQNAVHDIELSIGKQ